MFSSVNVRHTSLCGDTETFGLRGTATDSAGFARGRDFGRKRSIPIETSSRDGGLRIGGLSLSGIALDPRSRRGMEWAKLDFYFAIPGIPSGPKSREFPGLDSTWINQPGGEGKEAARSSGTRSAMPTLPTKSLFDKDMSLRSPFPRYVPPTSGPRIDSASLNRPFNTPSARTDFSQIKRPTPIKPKPSPNVSDTQSPQSDVPLSLRNFMDFPVRKPINSQPSLKWSNRDREIDRMYNASPMPKVRY
jgi:hypothetical protein